MEWISVEDNLPQQFEEVLFLDELGYIYIGHMYSERSCECPFTYVWIAYNNAKEIDNVKYWMKSPRRPEEFKRWNNES